MRWICFALLQILKICLGIRVLTYVFPQIRVKIGYRRILAVLLLVGTTCIQINVYWNCFLSYGNILVTGLLTSIICFLLVEEMSYAVSVFFWFYHVSVELLKVPCLVLLGMIQQKTLFWANYGERSWIEVPWYVLIMLGIYFLIYRKKNTLSNMRKLLEKYSLSIVGLGMAEWLLLTFVMWMGGTQAYSASVLMVAFLGIVSLIILFLYLLLKIVWQETESERNIMLASQELFLKHHEELKVVYAKNNQRLHDTKHMVLYLKNCISENRLGDAIEQLEAFEESIQNAQKIVWTGFDFPDFLINTKKAAMDEQKIQFRLDVDLTHIPMGDSEIGVILGNLFDNAIEAARQCPEHQREIYLKLCNRNEMFYLRMHNSSIKAPKIRNGKFVSSKTGDIHGFGIENVKMLVEQHQGSMEFQYDKTFFEVTILI